MNIAVNNNNPSAGKNRKGSRTFTVGAVGVTEKDFESLFRIFSITSCRPRSYRLLNIDPDKIENINGVDILLVNISDVENIVRWYKYCSRNQSLTTKQIVKILPPKRSADPEGYSIETPINPIRALKTLDTYTIRELNYLPEIEIGNETSLLEHSMANICKLRGEPQKPEKSFKALIADDSLAVRRQLNIEFELLGAETFSVDSGEEAILATGANKFDIIFLDVVMPGIDGYATCKKIRKSELNHRTPVIMLTSRSSSFDKFKGALAGCNSYLTKPISQNEFACIARLYLQQREKQREK